MSTTLAELKEHLITLDEVSLLEVLEINAEDIVDRFDDYIEERFDQLVEEFGNDEQE
jgi:hypothetical protein